jgi:methylaspartate mutase epsilon subunit
MLEEGEFLRIREGVLKQWPTGADVDFDEAVTYHQSLPVKRRFPDRLSRAKKKGEVLIQPRAGVALPEEHIKLLQYLENEGGADLLPTTIDSYTRQNLYEEAAEGIKESAAEGRSLLNGFPAVNHGVAVCRRVVESVGIPVQVRHGTPDARLLAEISFAGGFTSFEGGGISYNIPYAKRAPLDKTIEDWKYIDRLVGLYAQKGVAINREPFGPLTGTLVPPCISHAVAVLEALLAAEQGVTDITLGYGQCGNLAQDVAAMHTIEPLANEYLAKFGYAHVHVTTVLHQWMGGFPSDEAQAFAVIAWGAAAAALSGATKVITKSPHEALGIPTMEANAQGLRATKQIVSMLADQRMPMTHEMEEETGVILEETRAILDRTLELGNGDVAKGAVRAFEAGVIDVPFAPSVNNAGKILPARDNAGAVRFLNVGNLPFSPRILSFHKAKLDERAKFEKRDVSFQMVVDDIYAISKGRLTGRPK